MEKEKKKIVIIGGVAGGATAAARLRRLDEKAEIIIFEQGGYISYANCGLPYYIGGVIEDRDSLLVQTVEGFGSRYALDVRINSRVMKIMPEQKKIEVRDMLTGSIYEEEYDYLILSPGSKAIKPPIPGLPGARNLFVLKDMNDTDKLKRFISEQLPQKAVVIGGGFIGVEIAENLKMNNLEVTLIELSRQVLGNLDIEMAQIIHQHLHENGILLKLNTGVSGIEEEGKTVILENGERIKSDLIVLAVGVAPEISLTRDAAINLGETGAIKVDDLLKTNRDYIFALGDAIETKDFVTETPCLIPLAWPANRQARLVADNICGNPTPYTGNLGTSAAKVFELTAASTGKNEKWLKGKGYTYQAIHIHPNSHASYYPGAVPLSLKLLFNQETGMIYGAQAVGAKYAEKRIDVLATAIKLKATVYDLQKLELCYAPPYSSAKDPVNMLGYVAANIIENKVKTVQYYEIDGLLAEGNILLDVRDPEELEESGYIPGSRNIPLEDLRSKLAELKNKKIYLTCQVGMRGYLASRLLEANGFETYNLDGGYQTYADAKGTSKMIRV